jgi:hypothetical protein
MVDWMTFDSALDDSDQLMEDFPSLTPIAGRPEKALQNINAGEGQMLPQHNQEAVVDPASHCRSPQSPYPRCPDTQPKDKSSLGNVTNGAMRFSSYAKNRPDATTYQWPTDWDPSRVDNITTFPDMRFIPMNVVEAEDFGHVERLGLDVYQDILRLLEHTSDQQRHFKPFKNPIIPPLEVFNSFIQLYFEHFNPVFPLIHHPTFDPNQMSRVLVLATAAIGCRYSKAMQSAPCANALQELLRRAIAHTVRGPSHHVSGDSC